MNNNWPEEHTPSKSGGLLTDAPNVYNGRRVLRKAIRRGAGAKDSMHVPGRTLEFLLRTTAQVRIFES